MNWLRILALTLLAACCGGCDGWCDPEDYRYPYDMGFRISPDTGGPTNAGPYGLCKVGRVRKLLPRLLTRGTGTSCGSSCRQVTFPARSGGKGSLQYDLWGDHLVYRQQSQKDLYLVDLKADKEWGLLEHPPKNRYFDLKTTAAALYQGKVAYSVSLLWTDSPNNILYTSLLVYDIATQQEQTLGCWSVTLSDASNGGSISSMEFSEAGLVYFGGQVGGSGQYGNYHLDLATGKQTRLSGYSDRYQLWGHQLAWDDYTGDVMVTDLRLGKTTNLSDHKDKQEHAAIWKQRVVWTGHGDDPSCPNTEIYLYDLLTGKLEAVTSKTASFQEQPAIHGDTVAWIERERNTSLGPCGHMYGGGGDIVVKDLKTGKAQKLALSKRYKKNLRIWDDQLFFWGEVDRLKNISAIFAVKLK